jgi:hypothetical protein
VSHVVSYIFNLTRVLWVLAGLALIIIGFAVDGASEVGHHAGFIMGGVVIGAGLVRSGK